MMKLFLLVCCVAVVLGGEITVKDICVKKTRLTGSARGGKTEMEYCSQDVQVCFLCCSVCFSILFILTRTRTVRHHRRFRVVRCGASRHFFFATVT